MNTTAEEDASSTSTALVAAFSAAANSIFVTDRKGHILWVNQAFSRITGYAAQEALGQTPRMFKSGRQSDDWYRDLWGTISAGAVWRGRIVNLAKNGKLIDIEQTITPIRGSDGEIVNFISINEDITERVRSEERIHHLALFDSITELPNRNSFHMHLADALARARRSSSQLAVMLLDLDNFKNINDSLGHPAGDQLLAQLGQRLRGELREGDFAARLGGDEFALLTENVSHPEQAMQAAERMLQVVRAPYTIDGHTVHIGGSVGITLSPAAMVSPELMLKQADMAMYRAKASGRDRSQFFDAGMDAEAQHRFSTEAALRAAISDNALSMVYQPQYAMRDGQLSGMEALLRWRNRSGNRISPSEFVPMAEKCGLGLQLGDWVLGHVIRQAGKWKQRHGLIVPVAINVSASQFEQTDFAARVEALLREHYLSSSDVEIEITESIMLQKSAAVQHNIRRLKELDLKLAVDDFGTGYSSLLLLREYPVSRLKVDQSFVHGIGHDSKAEQIVSAVVALGHAMQLRVTGEGIETQEQEAFLRRLGCEEVQGFRYAKPLKPERIDLLLAARALTAKPV